GVSNQSLVNVTSGDYAITFTDAKGCTFIDTAILTDQAQMLVDVVATDIPCSYLTNGGAVSSIVAGGNPPYTFVWSNGSNQPGQQDLPAGIYSVTVYDKFGCTATGSDTIHIPPPLSGIVVSLSPACGGNNGCITVQGVGGTPPYTYVWPALGINGPTACGLGPGAYYVCIFDANHCQNDHIINLDSISSLGVDLSLTDATCLGIDNGAVVATVDPPTGVYNYMWQPQPQPNSPQIDSIAAGTVVSVTVTDANTGCVGTATDTIGAVTVLNIALTQTKITCPEDKTGTASAIASGGTNPYDYVWTYPDNSTVNGPGITGLGIGVYTVNVTDSLGCKASETTDISALSNPVAAYEMMVLDCDADGVKVQFTDKSKDSTNNIVAWNWVISWNGGSTTSNLQTPPSLQFPMDETGSVQLTVTSALGCTAVVNAPFEITGAPTAMVSTPSVDCENDPVTITITNGAPNNTYTWTPTTGLTFSPDATNVIASPTQTTVYQLIIANGLCKDTLERTVVRVEPIDLAVQDASITTCDTFALLSAQANAAANVTYVWLDSNNDTLGVTPLITVHANSQDTLFTVIATDPYGCSETANAIVKGNGLDLDVSFDPVMPGCANALIPLSITNLDPVDNLTYQWSSSSPNLLISPTNSASVTAKGPAGVYIVTVTVKNQFGCEEIVSTQLTIDSSTSLYGAISADLCHGLTVDFVNANSSVSGTWHFGDGDSSNIANPAHTYSQPGAYIVTFVSPETCVLPFDSLIMVLPSAAVVADFAGVYDTCGIEARIKFTDQSVHFNPIVAWNWTFSTGQTSNLENPLIHSRRKGRSLRRLL
ncbi:MAG TPA: PKD domain-containing protein, partial [Saprospiraceae bacterium]|nr:PKD domain-containing protein [Saprospiraceae bacterium]